MPNKFLIGYAVKSGVVASVLYLGGTLTWQHQTAQCVILLVLAALLSEDK